jgi:hypothetical protein
MRERAQDRAVETDVEPPVQRAERRQPVQAREAEDVDVRVHDVEAARAPRDHAELQDARGERSGVAEAEPPISRSARGSTGTSSAAVCESPDANSVTSCPRRTSSSVSQDTTRSVPP